MVFSCLQKLMKKCILLLYQKKRFKFGFSGSYAMKHGMSPLPKYNSIRLVFSEILGGGIYLLLGPGNWEETLVVGEMKMTSHDVPFL